MAVCARFTKADITSLERITPPMIYTIVRLNPARSLWKLHGEDLIFVSNSIRFIWWELVQDVKRNGYTWFVVRYV